MGGPVADGIRVIGLIVAGVVGALVIFCAVVLTLGVVEQRRPPYPVLTMTRSDDERDRRIEAAAWQRRAVKGSPMVEQLVGALSAAALLLGYLLVLQCMTAAVLLLCQYIAVQWRALRFLLEGPHLPARPEVEDQDRGEPYRVGGGLMRWP